ncbi:MAG: hypothetical protein JXA99_11375 [Candidatus Lokiarchaeota archaeon]|nr:hypothetical protein [Candidatus Lokiarchaeota archaeon]
MKLKKKSIILVSIVILMGSSILPTITFARKGTYDGVLYVFGSEYDVKYSHPDKELYNIEPWDDTQIFGTNLVHMMSSRVISEILVGAPIQVLITFITKLIEETIKHYVDNDLIKSVISIVIPIISSILVSIFGGIIKSIWQDEDKNIWTWTSTAFARWVIDNAGWIVFYAWFYYPICLGSITANWLNLGFVQFGSQNLFCGAHMQQIPQT